MSDSKAPQNKEIVDAVEITNIQHNSALVKNRSDDSSSSKPILFSALAVLFLLSLGVIFLLPKIVNNNLAEDDQVQNVLTQEENAKAAESDTTANLDLTVLQHQEKIQIEQEHAEHQQIKSEIEELVYKVIKLETKLQNHAVNKWAPDSFAQAIEQGRVGDEHFRRKQYKQATTPFETALAKLEELESSIQPTLEQALSRGELALTQGDQTAATQQFELANAIDSTNARAKNGLQRASTINELFKILQRASSFESHGQLQQAKSTYQQAIDLDPLSQQAKSALQRVEKKIQDQAYDQIIATAYSALRNGQYEDARAAFSSANLLKPNDSQARQGLINVANAIKQEKIDSLIFEANHFVQLQQWRQAVASYQKILQLDSQHIFAQQAKQQSLVKMQALEDLSQAIDSANLLYKDEVLEQAKDLLLRIEDLQSPGSVIDQQYKNLKHLVEVATTPVSITLESDGNTQVTVFRVARLGAFKRHVIQLRPGPYTIVGVRNGYRDVRITVELGAEDNNSVISVVNVETI